MDLCFTPAPEAPGAPVLGPYFETFWLPIIGPTSTCIMRYLVRAFSGSDTLTLSDADLAHAIGLGDGRRSTVNLGRQLARLVKMRMLIEGEHGCWQVRTTVRPLTVAQVHRLPAQLRTLHALVGNGSARLRPVS